MSFKTALAKSASILSYKALSHHYFILRLQHKTLAATAMPGHCLTMILPEIPPTMACIMNSSVIDNTVEILLLDKNISDTKLLDTTSEIQFLGLTGNTVHCDKFAQKEKLIVIAENIFIAAAVFFCRQWRTLKTKPNLLVLLGLDNKSPFPIKPSELLIHDMPFGVIASLPLLDDWNIPSRIASTVYEAGCFAGTVQELFDNYQKEAKLKNPKVILFN